MLVYSTANSGLTITSIVTNNVSRAFQRKEDVCTFKFSNHYNSFKQERAETWIQTEQERETNGTCRGRRIVRVSGVEGTAGRIVQRRGAARVDRTAASTSRRRRTRPSRCVDNEPPAPPSTLHNDNDTHHRDGLVVSAFDQRP